MSAVRFFRSRRFLRRRGFVAAALRFISCSLLLQPLAAAAFQRLRFSRRRPSQVAFARQPLFQLPPV
ncbi:hypothetical protein EAO22_22580 [Klebsiella pneumoniae]|nr:hypothetical protein EAO22_22580 [Klebsiella pneumoniae]